ncbi:inter-alpha-trypsin inhibitor heavy chain H3-like [Mytilus californianus]|uniref:inter-alpha-trypsin inhibitor heavy chain H3-like n=1 Tax=Mytilus californianus TaxID=6549 RepID=UPI002247EDB4|nr:inter-alpha-trypsin inhibitor heavy chain H3-like [Mytilus californianus]
MGYQRLHYSILILVFLFMQTVYVQTQNPSIHSMHIKSDITHRFATTLVSSKVVNSVGTPVEASFQAVIPDSAFIIDFLMEINGQVYHGEIKKNARVKEKYDRGKNSWQNARHVKEKFRYTNRFSFDINVPAESTATFNLTYQELLERVNGRYQHKIYVDPGQIVEDLKVDVAISEARNITRILVPQLRNNTISNKNEEENALAVIDRPTPKSATIQYAPTANDQKQVSDQGISGLFVVDYDVQRKFDAGEFMISDGYFTHLFAPESLIPIPKDVLFILDVSSSMFGTEIQQQNNAIDTVIQDFHNFDRFNIMEFSTNAKLWQPEILNASNENKQKARQYLKEMQANGYTDINNAMLKGLEFLNNISKDGNRMKMMVFLTDGQASKGEQNRSKILSNIDEKNIECIPIFSLAYGNEADYEFIKTVAVKNNGIARKLFKGSDASLQIKQFFNEISSPSLRNVTLKYLNKNTDIIEKATTLNFDTFFNGKEIVAAGKLFSIDGDVIDVLSSGIGVDGPIELALEIDIQNQIHSTAKTSDYDGITERVWAYLTIKQLLEKAIGEYNTTEKMSLNHRARQLSLKYKFVTPLTTVVVTLPDKRHHGTFEENEDALLALALHHAENRKQSVPKGIKRKANGSSSGSSTEGGGGGDPHFMVKIEGIEYPICFDVDAGDGDVIQILKDPLLGMTINAGIIGSRRRNRFGKYKTFIGNIFVMTPSVQIHIKPNQVIVNGSPVSWNNIAYASELVRIHVNKTVHHDETMFIHFGNDISVIIRRLMNDTYSQGVDYLNFNIDKETGISNIANGILGQFVHKKTSLLKVSLDKHGRKHGHFREFSNNHRSHFKAILHQKPDIISGEKVFCWNVHKKTKGLLNDDLQEYFVPDITSV